MTARSCLVSWPSKYEESTTYSRWVQLGIFFLSFFFPAEDSTEKAKYAVLSRDPQHVLIITYSTSVQEKKLGYENVYNVELQVLNVNKR